MAIPEVAPLPVLDAVVTALAGDELRPDLVISFTYSVKNFEEARVEVRFDDRRLRDLVASQRDLVRRFGEPCARKIGQRLQQLRVAETLADLRLMAGRCHQLNGDLAGCLALDLVHPLRLVFEPSDPPDGPLDWAAVRAVIVLDIVDYH